MQPLLVQTKFGPLSEWDRGRELRPGEHFIPGRGIVSASVLYAEDKARPGRGLRFTLAQASAIKRRYWSGEATQADLAREHDCTTVTIARIVHGKTYWYA